VTAPAASPARRRTLDQLGVVCKRIERILNGQELTLAEVKLPHEQRPGETPLERLRRFKAELQATLARQERGEPALCERCRLPIPPATLDEMPWATLCPAH
jgi:hypothetical protein